MKLTIQNIFLSIVAFALSVASAVIGMYMVFLADMLFQYRLLFAAIFMFNPILTGFLIAYMFKKALPKAPKEPKGDDKRKDTDKEETGVSLPSAYDGAGTGYGSGAQYGSGSSDLGSGSGYGSASSSDFGSDQEQPGTEVQSGLDYAAGGEDAAWAGASSEFGAENETAETKTAETDADNASKSKADIKSKLKFWEKSKDL